ncbi:BQ2448_6942 [Microbotryum intermedium]|uniref:BQ2448_6942 protein n=1 Tax=Microbotryum intermedium TaxID=269621 RepID=A0A238FIF1_9BASI|nr:BQ2448_6942 [Microbotryum intermedium]
MLQISPSSKLVFRNQALLSAFQTNVRHASSARAPAGTPRSLAPKSSPAASPQALATTATTAPIKSELPELLDVLQITRKAMSFDVRTSPPSLSNKALAKVVFGKDGAKLTPESPWKPKKLEFFGDREASRIAAEVILIAMQLTENNPGSKPVHLSQLASAMTTNEIFNEWAHEVGMIKQLQRHGGVATYSTDSRLANLFETYVGALHMDQGAAGPTYFLAPLFVREYNKLCGVDLLPIAGADSSERLARSFKPWIPNTISSEDYDDMRGALQASNEMGEMARMGKKDGGIPGTPSTPPSVPSKPLLPPSKAADPKTSAPLSKAPNAKKQSSTTPPSTVLLPSSEKKGKKSEPKPEPKSKGTPKKPTPVKLPQTKPQKVSVVTVEAPIVKAKVTTNHDDGGSIGQER